MVPRYMLREVDAARLFNGSDTRNFQFKNLGASFYAIEIFTLNILAHQRFSWEFLFLLSVRDALGLMCSIE
jgi:hypothetical protein